MKENFIDLLFKTLPHQEASNLLDSLKQEPTTSLRVNHKKTTLSPENSSKVAHCESAFFLNERPVFTADPAFHAGAYYVQEANSMWIGRVFQYLRQTLGGGVVVLDLCAAPGGKTTHISSLMEGSDLLVANEVISGRKNILAENVSKWGDGNTWVCNADPAQFGRVGPLFDMVFCDAPCSGEGMFRKDRNAQNEWSLENVALCSLRQQRIVSDSWNSLKEGGYLVYSTCTFNAQENEDNVSFICNTLGGTLVDVSEIDASGALYSIKKNQYRCLPYKSKGEGLFFAVIQKTASCKTLNKNKPTHTKAKDSPILGFSLVEFKSKSWLIPNSHTPQLNLLNLLPGLFQIGTPFGDVFKEKWKPHSAVALLHKASNLPVANVSDDEAMAFLRREFISKKTKEAGAVVVRWNGFDLGVANAIKNGLNNLWPMEWRVRNVFQCNSLFSR